MFNETTREAWRAYFLGALALTRPQSDATGEAADFAGRLADDALRQELARFDPQPLDDAFGGQAGPGGKP